MPSGSPVLIVDDDRSTRLMLRAQLSAAGCRAVEARSGEEAMRVIRTEGCRIILTDWLMPDLDGLELCRLLRADAATRGTYVVMITVNSDSARLAEAFEAGVDDFLPKPFEPGVLFARMRAAWRTIELQDNLLARNRELEAVNRRLLALATTDELTGLANRRHGLARLRDRWVESKRDGYPLSLAMLDIDHFKRFNDNYGHAIGDRVLSEIAGVLRRSCRESDTVCRYGGEEFLVVLPNFDLDQADVLASRWRDIVSHHQVVDGPLRLGVTVSIGIAARSHRHAGEIDFIRAADVALYAAKERGRNAVGRAA